MAMVLDTKKSNFGSQELLRLHIWFTVALLKNATNIITKCDKNLFQNASGFLLQNVSYYKMCRYKVETFIDIQTALNGISLFNRERSYTQILLLTNVYESTCKCSKIPQLQLMRS